MSDAPFLSLVIPAYNEAQRLEASLRALRGHLASTNVSHEVVLVVERSTDGTLELARKLTEGQAAFRVVGNETQLGKGHAVRTGMLAARGEITFFMDADLSTPLEEITTFLAFFDAHPEVDILIGNRAHAQSEILKKQSIVRRKMGQTFNTILRAITGIRIADTQCGFKTFRRAAREAIFPLQQLNGFAFDVEILLLAQKLGYRIADLPVRWMNAEGSKVRLLRDSFQMLRDALRVRCIIAQTKPPATRPLHSRSDKNAPSPPAI